MDRAAAAVGRAAAIVDRVGIAASGPAEIADRVGIAAIAETAATGAASTADDRKARPKSSSKS